MNFDIQKYLKYINGQTTGKNIYYIPETESTNDAVWDYYQDEDYLILVTDNQTEGRGRRENKWFSASVMVFPGQCLNTSPDEKSSR